MPAINRITNPNRLVEKKVNYFLDRLNHAVSYAGWQSVLEIETPTSLIEKIVFRLTEDAEYRLEYLDNYFKNPFFTSDTFWDNYPNYSAVKLIVREYNLLGRKNKPEKIKLIDSSKFQGDLKLLLRDLIHKMPEDLINGILGNVLCPHQLDDIVPNSTVTHAESFTSTSLMLASEYFFRGYTRSEIREIINRVFSKDEQTFPFPPHIQTKRQRQKYLAEGQLKNQLHGFTNVFKIKPNQGTIMVKVFGGIFPDDFEFRYDKVKFWGKGHPFILKLKQQMAIDDRQDFFGDGDYILASTEINWFSQDSLLSRIKNCIRRELVFLSALLDRDFSVDTTQNYVRLGSNMKYKGSAWSTKKFDNPFTSNELEQLNDNGYYALRRQKGQAIDWFLSCEPLFVNAHKSESIADYWLYLETLLSYNRKDKKIKEAVSVIILNNEKIIRDRRLLNTLYDCFGPFNGGIRLLGVNSDRWRQIRINFRKGKIAKEIRAVDYPFIQELIKEYDTTPDLVYYKKAKEYYYRMLTEAYEYRNFFVHKGFTSNKSKIKLIITFPNIVIRLRWALFDQLKNGNHDTPFDLLIDKLIVRGEEKLHKPFVE